MIEGIRRSPRVGLVVVGILGSGTTVALPGEGGAQQRERFSSASGRFEKGMAMAVSLSTIECRDDPRHER